MRLEVFILTIASLLLALSLVQEIKASQACMASEAQEAGG